MRGGNEVYYVPTEPRLKEDWSRFFRLERYQNATVAEVAARTAYKKAPCYPFYRGFSTFSAVEQMARLGPHRVAILDRERRVVGILTQSMVISLIDQNKDNLGQFKDCRLREVLPALASQTICVQETTLTIDAFKLMATNVRHRQSMQCNQVSLRKQEHTADIASWPRCHIAATSLPQGISGVAVTSRDGQLVDNISVRDLRGIGTQAEHFERLWHNVKKYKEEVRRQFSPQTPPHPIHVTLDDTVATVIARMDDGNVHRVFVVEKERRKKETASGKQEEEWEEVMRPTHVITQRDMLRFLLFKMGLQPMSVHSRQRTR